MLIKPRIIRIIIDHQKLNNIVGKVEIANKTMLGISGLEKKFNEELAGKPARFKIMLDREKNWIDTTTREVAKGKVGEDIVLNQTIEELLAGKQPTKFKNFNEQIN